MSIGGGTEAPSDLRRVEPMVPPARFGAQSGNGEGNCPHWAIEHAQEAVLTTLRESGLGMPVRPLTKHVRRAGLYTDAATNADRRFDSSLLLLHHARPSAKRGRIEIPVVPDGTPDAGWSQTFSVPSESLRTRVYLSQPSLSIIG